MRPWGNKFSGKRPGKPTRKAARAGFDAQRPLDTPPIQPQRKKPRKWKDDELSDIGEIENE